MANLLLTKCPPLCGHFGVDVASPVEVVGLVHPRGNPDPHDLAWLAQRLCWWCGGDINPRRWRQIDQIHPQVLQSHCCFVFALGDNSTNSRVVIFVNSSNQLGYRVAAGGVAHLTAGTNLKTAGNEVKAVISWQVGSQLGSDDGNNAVTASGATNPTVDRLQLGQDDGGGASRLLGWIEYIEYSPAPIDAATAKVISAP